MCWKTTRVGFGLILAGTLVGVLSSSPLSAADTFEPLSPDITASFESIGFIIPFNGDENGNASVTVDYRLLGSGTWVRVHDAVRTPDRSATSPPVQGPTFSGRVFWLSEDTDYELRFWYSDPDGVIGDVQQVLSPVTTRSPVVPVTSNTYYLDPVNGDDNNPGTLADPWRTLSSVAEDGLHQAQPGDKIILRGGVYDEGEFKIRNEEAGDPNNWIVFEGYPGETAIIDGSDPNLRVPGRGHWLQHPSHIQIWYTDVSDPAVYDENPPRVSWGPGQLWLAPYFESEDHVLQDLIDDQSELGHGWHHDTDGSEGFGADRLFVWLPGSVDPNTVPMWVARTRLLMHLERANYVAVQGLTLRHAYACLAARTSPFPLFRNNKVHSCVYGMEVRANESEGAIIEDNEIYELGIVDDPPLGPDGPLWLWVKLNAEVERQGIKLRDAGPGAVVRNNYIHEVFNGVIFKDSTDAPLKNFEAYNNRLVNIADDAFEPEGNMINSAIWNNQIEGALAGISLAPVHVGPVFVMYNNLVDFWIRSIKFNHGYGIGPGPGAYTGLGPALIYHNTFLTTHPANIDNSDYDGLRIPGYDGGHDITTRNNIWQATARVADDTNLAGTSEEINKSRDMDYDCFWTTNDEVYASWWAAGYPDWDSWLAGACGDPTGCIEENGLNADPMFVDADPSTPADQKDLNLTASSPLIDSGVVIEGINDIGPFAFVGLAPDIGAREYGLVTLFADGFESGSTSAWSDSVP